MPIMFCLNFLNKEHFNWHGIGFSAAKLGPFDDDDTNVAAVNANVAAKLVNFMMLVEQRYMMQ